MRSAQLATGLIGAMALAGVVAGLWLAGGPGYAKAERRDRARMSDLRALGDFVRCLADRGDGVLPDTLGPEPACDADIHLADPFTGAPYRYRPGAGAGEGVGEGSGRGAEFSICATFEVPQRLQSPHLAEGSFDRATGCAHFPYESPL